MHKDIVHEFQESLLELDALTNHTVDLSWVEAYQTLPFKQLLQVFSVSVSIGDVEGMLLAGGAMIGQAEKMETSDNPYHTLLLDAWESDFSSLTLLLKEVLNSQSL